MARRRGSGRGSGMSDYTIDARLSQADLYQLKQAVRRAGKEARRELRRKIKSAAEIIQESIQDLTPVHQGGSYGSGRRLRRAGGYSGGTTYKQTHAPGLLKKSTRIKVGTLSATVYNNALAKSRKYPGGYRYGKRLEFDPKFEDRYAFFYPGYQRVKARAAEAFESVLRVARRAYLR